jgi:hypothetical protein
MSGLAGGTTAKRSRRAVLAAAPAIGVLACGLGDGSQGSAPAAGTPKPGTKVTVVNSAAGTVQDIFERQLKRF